MKSTREVSDKSEKRGAKNLGMRQQVNSGATAFAKGDLVDAYTVIDDKTLMKVQAGITLKMEYFSKIKEEMFSMRKRFCGVRFNFGDPKVSFVAVSEADFAEIYNAWKELYGGE